MASDDALKETFRTAVLETLQEMASVEAVARGASGDAPNEVLVGLRLGIDSGPWAVLSFPRATAEALAQRILVGVPLDAGMIQDCMGELLNVITGRAKTLTFGTPEHFTFTTPVHLTGKVSDLSATWSMGFASDAGGFDLVLCPELAVRSGGLPTPPGVHS